MLALADTTAEGAALTGGGGGGGGGGGLPPPPPEQAVSKVPDKASADISVDLLAITHLPNIGRIGCTSIPFLEVMDCDMSDSIKFPPQTVALDPHPRRQLHATVVRAPRHRRGMVWAGIVRH